MRAYESLLAALLLGSSAAALAASTDAEIHINELISREPAYQQSWAKLAGQDSGLPQWVVNLEGVSTPVQTFKTGAGTYRVASLCKPHDCFNNRLYVAFAPDKKDVDALYVTVPDDLAEGEAPSNRAVHRWLGGPGFEVRKLLDEQLQSDPNWH
ncbi:inhibitor of vertebrate lysozyme family protein [Ectopseudomonas mendocina]|uniref:Inhibitor of vertebrate lysozyme family protein n=1 Tax=Ectopseudomonas mendocina TaxID=300 RepID=A0ABZ2RGI6_ECTME